MTFSKTTLRAGEAGAPAPEPEPEPVVVKPAPLTNRLLERR
jgi:hypothetical protein